MTRLNQLLAIDKGLKPTAERAFTNAYHALQKPGLFAGLQRTYHPNDEEGDQLPPESTLVQRTAPDGIRDSSAPARMHSSAWR